MLKSNWYSSCKGIFRVEVKWIFLLNENSLLNDAPITWRTHANYDSDIILTNDSSSKPIESLQTSTSVNSLRHQLASIRLWTHAHDVSKLLALSCLTLLAILLLLLVAALGLRWEHLPSTNVARVRFPHSASNVDWVCWFSTLLWEVFPRVLRFSPLIKPLICNRFSPLIKNQHLIWFVNNNCKIVIWAMLIWFPLEL